MTIDVSVIAVAGWLRYHSLGFKVIFCGDIWNQYFVHANKKGEMVFLAINIWPFQNLEANKKPLSIYGESQKTWIKGQTGNSPKHRL